MAGEEACPVRSVVPASRQLVARLRGEGADPRGPIESGDVPAVGEQHADLEVLDADAVIPDGEATGPQQQRRGRRVGERGVPWFVHGAPLRQPELAVGVPPARIHRFDVPHGHRTRAHEERRRRALVSQVRVHGRARDETPVVNEPHEIAPGAVDAGVAHGAEIRRGLDHRHVEIVALRHAGGSGAGSDDHHDVDQRAEVRPARRRQRRGDRVQGER